jgi:hypothetical protein
VLKTLYAWTPKVVDAAGRTRGEGDLGISLSFTPLITTTRTTDPSDHRERLASDSQLSIPHDDEITGFAGTREVVCRD